MRHAWQLLINVLCHMFASVSCDSVAENTEIAIDGKRTRKKADTAIDTDDQLLQFIGRSSQSLSESLSVLPVSLSLSLSLFLPLSLSLCFYDVLSSLSISASVSRSLSSSLSLSLPISLSLLQAVSICLSRLLCISQDVFSYRRQVFNNRSFSLYIYSQMYVCLPIAV